MCLTSCETVCFQAIQALFNSLDCSVARCCVSLLLLFLRSHFSLQHEIVCSMLWSHYCHKPCFFCFCTLETEMWPFPPLLPNKNCFWLVSPTAWCQGAAGAASQPGPCYHLASRHLCSRQALVWITLPGLLTSDWEKTSSWATVILLKVYCSQIFPKCKV